jgi:hypothetical protein
MTGDQIKLLQMMAERLERLNADSKWARRTSGTRGGVIKALEQIQQGIPPSQEAVERLIGRSMELLSKAAREIPDNEISKVGKSPER